MEENLSDDDTRLHRLETQGVKTEGRLSHVENTLVVHGTKLDQIITSVQQFTGRPIFDIHKMISTIRDILGIAGVFGFLAVWLIVTINAATERATALEIKHNAEIAAIRNEFMAERINRLYGAFAWKPSIEGVK